MTCLAVVLPISRNCKVALITGRARKGVSDILDELSKGQAAAMASMGVLIKAGHRLDNWDLTMTVHSVTNCCPRSGAMLNPIVVTAHLPFLLSSDLKSS